MNWFRTLLHRIRAYRQGRPESERDLHDELAAHIDFATEDNLRLGMSPAEARRAALLRFGGVTQIREQYRTRQRFSWFEDLIADLRFALRQLARSPGYAITAILTLALGIGANTVIYSLIDSILLRPLPFTHPDRLVRISDEDTQLFPKGWIRELGTRSRSFQSIAGYGPDVESNLVVSGGLPDRVFGSAVTVNAFETLGVHPVLGSFFEPGNAVEGQDEVVVLSYGYWRQHFAGNPAVLGLQIRVDGVSRRIIGVLPAGVHFPWADSQFVVPVAYRTADPIDPWKTFELRALGRLADGATPTQAQGELRALHGQILTNFPWRMPDVWASHMTALPLLESETGSIRPRLLLLFGAVGLILLIACGNVANLMLARSAAREREIAVRSALGASGSRLIRQLFAESLLLGVLAGAVALGVTAASLSLFTSLLPSDTPRIENVSLRGSVVLFAAAASLVAAILFGLIPTIKLTSLKLLDTLRSGSRSFAGRASQFRLSMVLVVAQIGLSVVVIAAAALMLHSLFRLSQVDPGFRTGSILTAEVSLDASACTQKGRCQAFYSALADRARSMPGAQSAALADAPPMSGVFGNYVYDAEGHPRDARQGALVATGRTVSPGYFDVLGLRLIRGRMLNESDRSGSSRAAIINQRMAEKLWPGQDPLGKHVIDVVDEASPAVWNPEAASIVVGVVSNTRAGSLDRDFTDEVYLPMTDAREHQAMYLLLRTRLTPSEAAAALRHTVAEIDPMAPVTRIRSLAEVVSGSIAAPRSLALLLVGFGALATTIGAVGIYSLIAYIVSWRTREIGIRLALGAQRWQIVYGIVRQSLLLALAGSALGLLGSIVLARLLHSFLFEVSAADPLTFTLVPLFMMLVALAASWIPAQRASSVDPMEALRTD